MSHVQTVSITGFFAADVDLPTISTTAGNSVALGAVVNNAATGTVSDNKSNTFVAATANPIHLDGSVDLRAWKLLSIAGGAGHVITLHTDGNISTFFATEFAGRAISGGLDAENSSIQQTTAQTTHTGPALTVSASSDVWAIMCNKYGDTVAYTHGTNYTIPTNGNQSSATFPAIVQYRANVSAGTETPTVTTDVAAFDAFIAFAFKVVPSGSPGNASGAGVTDTASAPAGSAAGSTSVSVTLKSNAGVALATTTRKFWTRSTVGGAAVDGGSSGLSITSNGSGVFALSGLTIAGGAGWLTYKDAADDLTCHTVPVTFA